MIVLVQLDDYLQALIDHWPILMFHLFWGVGVSSTIRTLCVWKTYAADNLSCNFFSQDESLFLTGPKRGLVSLDDIYVETDLKIKDHLGQDRELSKGVLPIRGCRSLKKCEVGTDGLATRLSTVDVMYAALPHAVEGTIIIRVLPGSFDGTITAHTTSVQEKIVLYDSKVAGAQNRPHGRGLCQLMRPALSVFARDKLIVVAETAHESACCEFSPAANGAESAEMTLGATKITKIDVTVAWSIMDP